MSQQIDKVHLVVGGAKVGAVGLVALQAKVRAVVVVVNRTRDRLQTRGLPLGSIKIRLEYLKQRIVRRVKLKVKVKWKLRAVR